MTLMSRVKMSSILSPASSGSTVILVQFQKAITVLFIFVLSNCYDEGLARQTVIENIGPTAAQWSMFPLPQSASH